MTNLDSRPEEIDCVARAHREAEVLLPRDVPLGGVRAMTVRRTLPARGRPFIGPWCFLDHYGPDDVARTGGMDVAPHPHCGLATVSWLFRGEIDHRDSLGTHALVLPGELNLMTAGRGIAHSEVSTPPTSILHGVQLWAALPAGYRDTAPQFTHYAPREVSDAGVRWRVFLGEIGGEVSPIGWHSPLLGAEITLGRGAEAQIPLHPEFEHGVLVDAGPVQVDGRGVPESALLALPAGRSRVRVTAATPARILLIGGPPYESDLVMWWNFVGGSHEEIAEARRAWQSEIGVDDDPRADPGAGDAPASARFGTVLGYGGAALSAPRMPGGRLRPRHASRAAEE